MVMKEALGIKNGKDYKFSDLWKSSSCGDWDNDLVPKGEYVTACQLLKKKKK